MNETQPIQQSELIFRRLTEPLNLFGSSYDPIYWLGLLIPLLLLGLAYVVWMYRRDAQSIHWAWASVLGLLRFAVYLILALIFLLPARQNWEQSKRFSRVIVVFDVSPSMTKHSDDPSEAPSGKPPRPRMEQVIDFLTDPYIEMDVEGKRTQATFLQKLARQNPVWAYRFARQLDEEAAVFAARDNTTNWTDADWNAWMQTSEDAQWKAEDWRKWMTLDLKYWLLRQLSPAGREALATSKEFDPQQPGNDAWAAAWSAKKPEEIFPANLPKADRDKLTTLVVPKDTAGRNVITPLLARSDLALRLTQGTEVAASIQTVLEREARNMPQAVIVFSDGRSNLGSDSNIAALRQRAKSENVPIVTVAVGQARERTEFRFTDVQVPSRTPPDEPFKVYVEADGEGFGSKEVEIFLDVYLPDAETPSHSIPGRLKFPPPDPSPNAPPPHATTEFILDPTLPRTGGGSTSGTSSESMPEPLPEHLLKKRIGSNELLKPYELIEGRWTFRARAVKPDAKSASTAVTLKGPRNDLLEKTVLSDTPLPAVRVAKRAPRTLLIASGPNHDFQFLRTQLVRDQVDLSIWLQNEGGRSGQVALDVPPHRVLKRFPYYMTARKAEDAPETKEANKDPDNPERYYDLNLYDLIIAFDPDWTQLSAQEVRMLKSWVQANAGGLIIVAGNAFTYQLASLEPTDPLYPLLSLYPVVPKNIRLGNPRKSSTKVPYRLSFPGISPDTSFLRLDDSTVNELTGWERFFTGRDDPPQTEPKQLERLERGFYSYYPLESLNPAAQVIARFVDPLGVNDKGEYPPYLVTMSADKGRTVFIASAETRRLRQYNEGYFERFWTKLARYASEGRMKDQVSPSRMLMNTEFASGGYIRMRAELFEIRDSIIQPIPKDAQPRFSIEIEELASAADTLDSAKTEREIAERQKRQQAERDRINQAIKKKFEQESTVLLPETGRATWRGVFQKQIRAEPSIFPPGKYRIKVAVPNSSDVISAVFSIVSYDRELRETQPDEEALRQMATPLEELRSRISNDDLYNALQRETLKLGGETQRLLFRIENREALRLVSDMIKAQERSELNRSGLVDLWDQGPVLESRTILGIDIRESKLPWLLLLAVGLLTVEWLIRKLLRLA